MARGLRVAGISIVVTMTLGAIFAITASWGGRTWEAVSSYLSQGGSGEDVDRYASRIPEYRPDVDDAEGLTEEQVRQIAYDVCPRALGVGDCLDYTVEVTDLDGALGLVEVSWKRPEPGISEDEVLLEVSGVMLDRSIKDKPAQYVANVAAHEWNHVEQAHIVKSLAGRNALERAFSYYDARASGGLEHPGLGVEILTDCMATEGDNVPVSVGSPSPPYYIKKHMGVGDIKNACGDWRGVLYGTVK